MNWKKDLEFQLRVKKARIVKILKNCHLSVNHNLSFLTSKNEIQISLQNIDLKKINPKMSNLAAAK